MSFIWNALLGIFPVWFKVVILAFIAIILIYLIVKFINLVVGAIPFL